MSSETRRERICESCRFKIEDSIWCLRYTESGGSFKNSIHSTLISNRCDKYALFERDEECR
jgi:hypothetical protein